MEFVRQLSANAKAEIKALSGARPKRFIATLVTTWLTIAGAISIAHYAQNIIVSLIAVYVVATRQNILGLLVHEQTHYTGIKTANGDLFVNLFAGYPLLVMNVENYAKIHLAHHRHFFTDADPDFVRKNGADWTFPMRPAKLAFLFLQDLVGIGIIRLLAQKSSSRPRNEEFKRKQPPYTGAKLGFVISVGIFLTLVGGWSIFLIYWIVPLITVLPLIVRWGAICEHLYGKKSANVEDCSPVIMPSTLGRIFLPNLNFTMHAYHHYFPAVSFANLPAVHEIFVREGLVQRDLVFSGQFSYLRYIVTSARHQPAEPEIARRQS